jgi:2-polyprenyl-3-methyl-5-hydroxy-6-metoxy-1,4-benzoquinol methylase
MAKAIELSARRRSRPWPHNLVDMVEEYSPVGNILDVGCATGEFLVAARKNGWEAKGVEYSVYSSGRARDAHNLEVFTGSLQDAVRSGAFDEKYDVVTLWDTAEHLEDPMAVFKSAWVALRPGGLLFVQTLNIDGNIAAEQGIGWHFFRPPKHLFYFSEKTLKEYFARSGFRLLKDDEFWKDVVVLAGQKPG